MTRIDARRLKQEVQQAIRDQVIRLRKEGRMNRDIAHFLGISEQHTSTIWQRYQKGGKKAVLLGTQGRRQEGEVERLLIDKTPDQLKFPFALWTREGVTIQDSDVYTHRGRIRKEVGIHSEEAGHARPRTESGTRKALVYCLSNIFTIVRGCAMLGACGNQPISS
jgi:transposase